MKQKLIWPDRLRNIATFLVVIIHVCAAIPMQGKDYDSSVWWTGNIWCSLGRPAVPIFVMLSGFLLLSRTYPLGEFFRRRFTRVVIPALFWFGVYGIYNHFGPNGPETFGQFVRQVIVGPVHYHLWFLYLIIGLYITYPVIAPFVRQASEREFLYFFGVCLYGTWGIKVLKDYFGMEPMLSVELFTNNAIYFFGGYYLVNKTCIDEAATEPRFAPWPITQRQMVGVALALIAFGWAWTAVGTWHESKQNGAFFGFFYDYLNPSVTVAAVGWFLLARYALNFGKLAAWEIVLSSASFGIYLIHPMVRDWLSLAGYWQDKYHPAKCIPIVAVCVLLFSFIGIIILRALPGGEKVT
jgi:surface polysaccharide O-acyltransferase-like enzyme